MARVARTRRILSHWLMIALIAAGPGLHHAAHAHDSAHPAPGPHVPRFVAPSTDSILPEVTA